MNKESLFFKLNILFLIAIVSTSIAFIFVLEHQYFKERQERIKNLKILLQEYRHKREFSSYILELLNASLINGGAIGKIIAEGKILKHNIKLKHDQIRIKIIEYNQRIYFLVEDSSKISMLYIRKNSKNTLLISSIFIFIILLLISLYIIIRQNLKPLKYLEEAIKNYSFGDEVNLKLLNSTNEVAKINNAFLEFSKNTKALKNSKDLFIKNIFHELNTPVTKGKLLAEITEDENLKKMLKSIFNRLSILLNELAKVEQIVSKNYQLKLTKIPVVELIDSAKDLLFLDDVRHNITNQVMVADFKSMSIVFKNLIDNGLKYGNDFYIHYNKKDNKICFINRGEEIKELDYYLEPFVTTNINRSSLGLGLFIVTEILTLHNKKLIYFYKDGKNHFCITL